MGRAPVGAVVTGVRRARARAVTARVVVVLAVGVSVAAGVVPVAPVDGTEAGVVPVAVDVETVTRALSAPASASSPS